MLDFGRASTLVKSRKIGGTYSIAAAVAIWTILGEATFLVSLGQKQADNFLLQVERHLKVLAELGSDWALPARKLYIVGKDTLRVKAGGEVVSTPTTEPARSFGGNIVFDEAAYYGAFGKIWDAAAPAAMLGKKRIRVLSTPNGLGGLFHEMCTSRKDVYRTWRRWSTTLDEALAQGYQLDEVVVHNLDHGNAFLHAQLFGCSFLARGGSLFHGVAHYRELPKTFRRSIGLDFAYTQKTRSDFNVAVVMCESGGRYYVEEVVREQTSNFTPYLQMLAARFPGVKMHHYPNVAEVGMDIQLFATSRLPVHHHKIVAGRMNESYKYTHAIPLAQAWNALDPEGRPDARVLVPATAPWLPEYLNEIATFTGERTSEGKHDDQVDATVAAFLALQEGDGVTDQFGTVKTHFRSGDQIVTAQGQRRDGSGWMRW